MHVASVDQGFVAAPPERVYPLLSAPLGYAEWWPDALPEGVRLGARAPLAVRADGYRDGAGLVLHLLGPLTGTLEWYLEPFEDGTIVYAILNLEPPGGRRRSERRLLRSRASLRRGLVGLKRALEAV